MILTSSSIQHEKNIPSKFTCDGEDRSPDLSWSDVPDGTRSFILIVHDPDAPAKDWLHWLVVDISATTRSVAAGVVPAGGRQLPNDFQRVEWGGPCPPNGVHRYFFELYAVDVPTITAGSLDEVKSQLSKHCLATATLVGTYQRQHREQ